MSEHQPAQALTPEPTVAVGRYGLAIDSHAGSFALFEAEGETANAQRLADVLRERHDGEEEPGHALGQLVEDASTVTGRCEQCVRLFTQLAQGKALDPKMLSEEVDDLLGLLGRLDRAGRHEEALRLARDLSALLALLLRWLDLIRSLELALRTARTFGDRRAEAWAVHELGTLHLVAGEAAEAEEYLREALRIKQELGGVDRCASRHNLDSARRDVAREQELARSKRQRRLRLAGAAAVLALLASGGGAVAVAVTPSRDKDRAVTEPRPVTSLTATQLSTASTATRRHSVAGRPPAQTHSRGQSTRAATSTSGESTGSHTVPSGSGQQRDTTAPRVRLVKPADGIFTNDSLPIFAGSAGAAAGDAPNVIVFISTSDGRPAGGSPLKVRRANTSFAVAASEVLPDGTYTVYATQADAADHTATTTTHAFTVDTVPPRVSLACGQPGGTIDCRGTASERDHTVELAISQQPSGGGEATVRTTSLQVARNGSFAIHLGLQGGMLYELVASQVDAAGNRGASEPVTFETGPF